MLAMEFQRPEYIAQHCAHPLLLTPNSSNSPVTSSHSTRASSTRAPQIRPRPIVTIFCRDGLPLCEAPCGLPLGEGRVRAARLRKTLQTRSFKNVKNWDLQSIRQSRIMRLWSSSKLLLSPSTFTIIYQRMNTKACKVFCSSIQNLAGSFPALAELGKSAGPCLEKEKAAVCA